LHDVISRHPIFRFLKRMRRAFTMTNLIGTATAPGVPGVLGSGQGTDVAVAGLSGANGYGVFGANIPIATTGLLQLPMTPGEGPVPALSTGAGVYGYYSGAEGPGVYGSSSGGNGPGLFGTSTGGNGVTGISNGSASVSGVWGNHTGAGNGLSGTSASGNGVWGYSTTGKAGFFQGDVQVTGDITLGGGDCAEEFDVTDNADIEPGTVLVLDQHGALRSSQHAYDKKVAGVISGAGAYRPGLILDRQQSSETRVPVALMGKVYCKVDAQYVAIEVGDLLTTSPTPGHAMKASDPLQAFGAVIGKALRPLKSGQDLVPILVALQ
jgi:hypothetical protein